MSLVYPILPRAGLGNMLLIWARAAVFSQINELPMIAPTWTRLRIGPYLRQERDKRNYQSFFTQSFYIPKSHCLPKLIYLKRQSIHNIALEKLEDFQTQKRVLYVFEGTPVWKNCFKEIVKYQPIVKQQLLNMLSQSVIEELSYRKAPVIGIHIRMGDFKAKDCNENLTKDDVHARTPLDWFINVIQIIREVAEYELPVTVFSDGHDSELSEILNLPNVTRANNSSAIVDILTLSQSKLLVTSSRSTFSAWAAYLSHGSTIWHPAHFMNHFGDFSKYKDIDHEIFEGCIHNDNVPDQAVQVILDLVKKYHSKKDQ